MGALELSNPPGWGRKKRANAPSSVNTATFFIACSRRSDGGERERGGNALTPMPPPRFFFFLLSLIAQSSSAILSILMCDFLFQLTSSFVIVPILIKTKEVRLILQSGIYIYIFTNISEGTAFLLQGLTNNEELYLRLHAVTTPVCGFRIVIKLLTLKLIVHCKVITAMNSFMKGCSSNNINRNLI